MSPARARPPNCPGRQRTATTGPTRSKAARTPTPCLPPSGTKALPRDGLYTPIADRNPERGMIARLPVDELTDSQFEEISRLVKTLCGINLHSGKRELVRARLTRRLRDLGLGSFDLYLQRLRADDGDEIVALLDALSTNLTRFFREPIHFDILQQRIAQRLDAAPDGPLQIWSAGCSSGEEPYSIAIRLLEAFGQEGCKNARILATDLSTRVMATAREGVYPRTRLEDMDRTLVSRYFTAVRAGDERRYRVCDRVRRLVHFARLNLMDQWPMSGPFSVIMCRNVMIYFDKPTQQSLINRFWDLLRPGGILFIGHSESLTGVTHRFQYVQPTVYEKPQAESGVHA
ncbi:MAG: chemotaxis protein CheR [Armatimonadia bacterium]|nr:chemotaxis protein CheR [Armatimonadia bacterium]